MKKKPANVTLKAANTLEDLATTSPPLEECQAECLGTSGCGGFIFSHGDPPGCYLKSAIFIDECNKGDKFYDLYAFSELSPPPLVPLPPFPPPWPPLPPAPPEPPHPPLTPPITWEEHSHTNCWTGHGAKDLEAKGKHFQFDQKTLAAAAAEVDERAKKELFVAACKVGCIYTHKCTGFVFLPAGKRTNPACFRKTDIELVRCHTDGDIVLYKHNLPSPPNPPLPPPSPPLGNTIKFFAIGDWNFDHSWENEPNWVPGWVGNSHLCLSTCQNHIASLMEREANLAPSEYEMVINAGDNFYPFGVDSEHSWQWEERWGKVYSGLPDMVWYSTQGNHDLSQVNRACACARSTQGCSQIRKHMGKHQGHTWYMPDFNYWVKPFPGVPLEIISLDTNHHDSGRICPWNSCDQKECGWWEKNDRAEGSCFVHECQQILEERNWAAEDLLRRRLDANIGGNVIVFTHYPVNYFEYGGVKGEHGSPGIVEQLKRHDVNITFFGAHVHLTEGEEQPPTC